MRTEIETPTIPNFVRVRVGKQETVTIPISELAEEQIREIGERWTNDLITSAKRKRTNIL